MVKSNLPRMNWRICWIKRIGTGTARTTDGHTRHRWRRTNGRQTAALSRAVRRTLPSKPTIPVTSTTVPGYKVEKRKPVHLDWLFFYPLGYFLIHTHVRKSITTRTCITTQFKLWFKKRKPVRLDWLFFFARSGSLQVHLLLLYPFGQFSTAAGTAPASFNFVRFIQ